MTYLKVVAAGMFTFSSLGFATAGFANNNLSWDHCIDVDFALEDYGECIPETTRKDNGWGNGDQDAAGNSLDSNNAENYAGDNSDGTEGGEVTNSSGNP